MKILFVCSSNKDRSKTAEDLYKDDHRLEVKSCGVDLDAEAPVTKELVNWADVIVVMDDTHDRHSFKLLQKFPFLKPTHKKIVNFNIPDEYVRGEPALVSMIKENMKKHFNYV